jgi:hypothetical protein
VYVLLPAAAAEDFAGGRAGELAVIVFDLAIDDGVGDAFGELRGADEGGFVDDRSRIEDGDVGELAGFEDAAVFEMFALCGKRSDFADAGF